MSMKSDCNTSGFWLSKYLWKYVVGIFILTWLFIFRAYDRAAIKFRGVDADINFNVSDYNEDIKQVGIVVVVFDWIQFA